MHNTLYTQNAVLHIQEKPAKHSRAQSGANLKLQPQIPLVEDTPTGVRIGHPEYGDPRKPGLPLDGMYLNENSSKPLCVVKVQQGASEAKIEARLQFRWGEMYVTRIEDQTSVSSSSPDKSEIDRLLRERMAGLRFAKEFCMNLDRASFYGVYIIATYCLRIEAKEENEN